MAARILVVDDEESICFTFDAFLGEEGYKVTTAKNAQEAAALVLTEEFDLIFLDILLGGDSGVELLRRFQEKNRQSPIVMMTGFPTAETAAEALRLGAYDYLPKPINQQSLLRVTRMALRFKQLEQEKRSYQANLEAVFRSVKDAIITVNQDLQLVAYNAAAEKLCGFSPQLTGKDFSCENIKCEGSCLRSLSETLSSRTSLQFERMECRQKNGQNLLVTLNTAPLLDDQGRFSGAVLVIRDETRLNELERSLHERSVFHKIVGSSSQMQAIYDLLEQLAHVPTTVLITGESGTGKELIAEALHEKSARHMGPFIKVNCAALSENLLESELFGHVKGAFTGAVKDSAGRFERAHGGTIFLDEIGDLSPRLQVRLLRVLQEKTFERVGDATPICVDVRVVAATNQDLAAKIRSGQFREDLFYRLKVVNVALPALRERRSDIPLLIAHFIEKFNKKFSRQVRTASRSVEEFFMTYPWPGNIRELEHVIEHAFILCCGEVLSIEHLPPDLHNVSAFPPKNHAETQPDPATAIQNALEKAGGNKAKAARILGISRRTLYRKLQDHQIGID